MKHAWYGAASWRLLVLIPALLTLLAGCTDSSEVDYADANAQVALNKAQACEDKIDDLENRVSDLESDSHEH